jgi:hypothetical protein
VAQAARLAVALLAAAWVLLAPLAAEAASPPKDPRWAQLSAEQQKILSPLQHEWDGLEPDQRGKWVSMTKRYPKMTPKGQQLVQKRMERWAKLTPGERKQARENYRRISKVPPEKRGDLKQQWSEYQSLPPQERQKAQSAPKPKSATTR